MNEKYSEIFRFVFPTGSEVAEPKTESLSRLAANLRLDIAKLKALTALPVLSAGYAARAISNQYSDWIVQNVALESQPSPDKPIIESYHHIDDFNFAAAFWDAVLEDDYFALRDARDAMLAALTVWSYTVFESFSADLWIEAVNQRPALAKHLYEAPKEIEGILGERKDGKPMSLTELASLDFDLLGRMGDVLCNTGRVAFTSVDAIEYHYFAAFSNPASLKQWRPSVKLTETYAPHREAVRALACVRNMIVHLGGRADDDIVKQLRRRKVTTVHVEPGKQYAISSGEVATYALAATSLSSGLLAFVDDWLARHP